MFLYGSRERRKLFVSFTIIPQNKVSTKNRFKSFHSCLEQIAYWNMRPLFLQYIIICIPPINKGKKKFSFFFFFEEKQIRLCFRRIWPMLHFPEKCITHFSVASEGNNRHCRWSHTAHGSIFRKTAFHYTSKQNPDGCDVPSLSFQLFLSAIAQWLVLFFIAFFLNLTTVALWMCVFLWAWCIWAGTVCVCNHSSHYTPILVWEVCAEYCGIRCNPLLTRLLISLFRDT